MNELIEKIVSNVSRGFSHGKKAPHKLILLLTLAKMCEKEENTKNYFTFVEVEKVFETVWKTYVPSIPFSRSFLELPFNYLQSDHIWFLVPKNGCEEEINNFPRLTRARIIRFIEYGYLEENVFNLLCKKETREYFVLRITTELSYQITSRAESFVNAITNNDVGSSFVSYINSLNALDGNSDGALAERQAKEAFFCQIHVPHPFVEDIFRFLTAPDSIGHVILTGHAGDGKSTIALELYKKLKKLNADLPLDAGLQRREDLEYSGTGITIIKDLSEWDEEKQDAIWKEIRNGTRRYILVSNTGTLLSMISRNADESSRMQLEDKVLFSLDSPPGNTLKVSDMRFSVYNLALYDNLDVSMHLWWKMSNASGWEDCTMCPMVETCPIFQNISLIQQHYDVISDRLRMLLHRVFAYGGRLTLRQISAHFSYMLCSGHNCSEILEYAKSSTPVNPGDYYFFNHFFGDNAERPDERAFQLNAVRIIRDQGFELHPSPGLERYFWLYGQSGVFSFNLPPEDDSTTRRLLNYYTAILKKASIETPDETQKDKSSSVMYRKQVRRIVFFLQPLPEDKNEKIRFERFLGAFLNSEMLIYYERWIKNELSFSTGRRQMKEQLFHVLLEHFSGLRIAKPDSKDLYITMARKRHNIRQNVLIVLGKTNFNEQFELQLKMDTTNMTSRNKAVFLVGKNRTICEGLQLELPLPFLDYIATRKNGSVGSVLQRSYVDRLEKFKSDILERCKLTDDDEMVLLKQENNYSLSQYRLSLHSGILEVSHD